MREVCVCGCVIGVWVLSLCGQRGLSRGEGGLVWGVLVTVSQSVNRPSMRG